MMELDVKINDHFFDYVFDWNHYVYFMFGGYGSSKSYNTAIKLILKAFEEERRILVVREVHNTHADSTYMDLCDAIEILGLQDYFIMRKSPLSIICTDNNSKFIFRGLDNRKKLKSVKNVSICWLEEGEGSHDDYKELKDRLRMEGVEPHMIVTENPVSKNHWSYKEFIHDKENDEIKINEDELYEKKIISINDTYYHHSTFNDNLKHLNQRWINNLLSEKNELLRKIKVEGKFGTLGKKIFTNVEKVSRTKMMELIQQSNGEEFRGLDWGFATSYNALAEMKADRTKKELYIFGEYYRKGQKNSEIMKGIERVKRYLTTADSAEPKTIKEFQDAGFRMVGAKKGQGSVEAGIKKLQEFDKIYISEDCPNAFREFDTLEHPKDEKTGEIDESKYNIDPHMVDACRYGLERFRSFSHDLKFKVRR